MAWQLRKTIGSALQASPQRLKRSEMPRALSFAALARLALADLRAAPQHRYIIRLIDAPAEPLGLPRISVVQARGPFTMDADLQLFREHGVDAVLAKNSGGEATVSKIEAARLLGLPVYMVERPFIPARPTVETVEQAYRWLEHHAESIARGV